MAVSRQVRPSNTVVQAAADALARHVPPRARLVLGLSGGLDSSVLLHILAALRDQYSFELSVVHVHHGLSPHADDWSVFCAQLCALYAVEIIACPVRIALDDAAGIEAAARRERHQVFSGVEADFLLTAHHQNDQAETLLLQLLRGAGPKGLAAMAELQPRPGWRAVQLRPLLNVARADLLDYAQTHGLTWVEDDSNQDARYRRNALRQQIIPLLKSHFPGACVTLARAAALQADAAGLLDDLAQMDSVDAIQGARLDCAVLARLSGSRARNVLRHFVELNGHPMPSARRLSEGVHQLLNARHDARVCVSLGPVELWRFRGGAYLVPPALASAASVVWRGEASVFVPAAGVAVHMDAVRGAGLRRDALTKGEVCLGVRQGGERLRLHPNGPHRSLKNLLQEYAIPPWQRERLPLLWCDGRLAWVGGVGFDADWLAKPGEAGVMPRIEP